MPSPGKQPASPEEPSSIESPLSRHSSNDELVTEITTGRPRDDAREEVTMREIYNNNNNNSSSRVNLDMGQERGEKTAKTKKPSGKVTNTCDRPQNENVAQEHNYHKSNNDNDHNPLQEPSKTDHCKQKPLDKSAESNVLGGGNISNTELGKKNEPGIVKHNKGKMQNDECCLCNQEKTEGNETTEKTREKIILDSKQEHQKEFQSKPQTRIEPAQEQKHFNISFPESLTSNTNGKWGEPSGESKLIEEKLGEPPPKKAKTEHSKMSTFTIESILGASFLDNNKCKESETTEIKAEDTIVTKDEAVNLLEATSTEECESTQGHQAQSFMNGLQVEQNNDFETVTHNTKGKRKLKRTRYTKEDIDLLNKKFYDHPWLSPEKQEALAAQMGYSETQIKTWFQNKRASIFGTRRPKQKRFSYEQQLYKTVSTQHVGILQGVCKESRDTVGAPPTNFNQTQPMHHSQQTGLPRLQEEAIRHEYMMSMMRGSLFPQATFLPNLNPRSPRARGRQERPAALPRPKQPHLLADLQQSSSEFSHWKPNLPAGEDVRLPDHLRPRSAVDARHSPLLANHPEATRAAHRSKSPFPRNAHQPDSALASLLPEVPGTTSPKPLQWPRMAFPFNYSNHTHYHYGMPFPDMYQMPVPLPQPIVKDQSSRSQARPTVSSQSGHSYVQPTFGSHTGDPYLEPSFSGHLRDQINSSNHISYSYAQTTLSSSTRHRYAQPTQRSETSHLNAQSALSNETIRSYLQATSSDQTNDPYVPSIFTSHTSHTQTATLQGARKNLQSSFDAVLSNHENSRAKSDTTRLSSKTPSYPKESPFPFSPTKLAPLHFAPFGSSLYVPLSAGMDISKFMGFQPALYTNNGYRAPTHDHNTAQSFTASLYSRFQTIHPPGHTQFASSSTTQDHNGLRSLMTNTDAHPLQVHVVCPTARFPQSPWSHDFTRPNTQLSGTTVKQRDQGTFAVHPENGYPTAMLSENNKLDRVTKTEAPDYREEEPPVLVNANTNISHTRTHNETTLNTKTDEESDSDINVD